MEICEILMKWLGIVCIFGHVFAYRLHSERRLDCIRLHLRGSQCWIRWRQSVYELGSDIVRSGAIENISTKSEASLQLLCIVHLDKQHTRPKNILLELY